MENNTARILSPDEGVSGGLSYPATTSSAGNGYGTWDLGGNLPPDNAPNKGYLTRYATGYIDNHEDPDVLEAWIFGKGEGRHHSGANYLAADGHTVWLHGASVSAGYNAHKAGGYSVAHRLQKQWRNRWFPVRRRNRGAKTRADVQH